MTMGDVTVAANITLAETVKTTTRPHYTNTSAPTSDGPDRPVFITVFASKFIGLHDFFVLEIIKCSFLEFSAFNNLVGYKQICVLYWTIIYVNNPWLISLNNSLYRLGIFKKVKYNP